MKQNVTNTTPFAQEVTEVMRTDSCDNVFHWVFPTDQTQTHTHTHTRLSHVIKWRHCRNSCRHMQTLTHSWKEHTHSVHLSKKSHISLCICRQLYIHTPNHPHTHLSSTHTHSSFVSSRGPCGNWTSCEFLVDPNEFNTVLILLTPWHARTHTHSAFHGCRHLSQTHKHTKWPSLNNEVTVSSPSFWPRASYRHHLSVFIISLLPSLPTFYCSFLLLLFVWFYFFRRRRSGAKTLFYCLHICNSIAWEKTGKLDRWWIMFEKYISTMTRKPQSHRADL